MKIRVEKVALALIAMLIMSATCVLNNTVYADEEQKTGSITINAVEERRVGYSSTTTTPAEGYEYKVFKLDQQYSDVYAALRYIIANSLDGITKSTDENGQVIFSDLEAGCYYVEPSYDIYADGVFYIESSSFIVDIPFVNGENIEYDITVNSTIYSQYGILEFTKIDVDGNPISDANFKVQILEEGVPVSFDDVEEYDVWYDYTLEGGQDILTATTNASGDFTLDLPCSDGGSYRYYYRFIETSVPDGYIINNSIISKFIFKIYEYDGTVENESTLNNYQEQFITIVPNEENGALQVTYINEKPEISKEVKTSGGSYADSVTAEIDDTLTYQITADVPLEICDMSTYTISDSLSDALLIDRDSITVEATTENGVETVPSDVYTLSDSGLEIVFDTSKMYDTNSDTYAPIYSNIIVTYSATLDSNKVVKGDEGNTNTATLTYTNNIDVDGTEVSTTTTSDTATVIVEKTPAKVIVKYVDKYTNKEISTQTTIDGYVDDEYTATAKTVNGYSLYSDVDSITGTMKENTITITYYYVKKSTVVAKYIDEDTNLEISDLVSSTYLQGESYTTEQKTISGYTYSKVVGNVSGTVGDSDIEVIYYYQKVTGSVKVTYEDEDGNELATEEEMYDKVGEEYITTAKEIEGYKVIATPDNASGEYVDGIIEVKYVYSKTGTIVINFVDTDGNEIAPSITTEEFVGQDYYYEAPQIDGYTLVSDSIIETKYVDGELVYILEYENVLVDTSDIQVTLLCTISLISIAGLIYLLNVKLKKQM